jgi:hypothetical protein
MVKDARQPSGMTATSEVIPRFVVRVLAGVFAAMALVWPGYGAIDLSDTWNRDGNPVLSGGWGLFFGVVVAVPFLVVAAIPGRAAPAVWTLVLAWVALAVAAIGGLERPLVPFLGWLLLGILVVTSVGAVLAWRRMDLDLDISVIRTLSVGALTWPWLVYAWHMAMNNRERRSDTDITGSVDHYSVQAALGLVLMLMVLLATTWPRGRRQLTTYAAVCGFYLGVLSLRWPGMPGSIPQVGALSAIAWAAVVAIWGWQGRDDAQRAVPMTG